MSTSRKTSTTTIYSNLKQTTQSNPLETKTINIVSQESYTVSSHVKSNAPTSERVKEQILILQFLLDDFKHVINQPNFNKMEYAEMACIVALKLLPQEKKSPRVSQELPIVSSHVKSNAPVSKKLEEKMRVLQLVLDDFKHLPNRPNFNKMEYAEMVGISLSIIFSSEQKSSLPNPKPLSNQSPLISTQRAERLQFLSGTKASLPPLRPGPRNPLLQQINKRKP